MSEKTVRLARIAFIKEENNKPFILLDPPSGRRTKSEIPGCIAEEQNDPPAIDVRLACLEKFGVILYEMERLVDCEDSKDIGSLVDFWVITKWNGDIRPPELVWTEINHSLLSRHMLSPQHVAVLEKLIPWAVNKFPAFYYLAENEGLL